MEELKMVTLAEDAQYQAFKVAQAEADRLAEAEEERKWQALLRDLIEDW